MAADAAAPVSDPPMISREDQHGNSSSGNNASPHEANLHGSGEWDSTPLKDLSTIETTSRGNCAFASLLLGVFVSKVLSTPQGLSTLKELKLSVRGTSIPRRPLAARIALWGMINDDIELMKNMYELGGDMKSETISDFIARWQSPHTWLGGGDLHGLATLLKARIVVILLSKCAVDGTYTESG